MALVKKLNIGGPLNLDDALNQELGQFNLKSKDERKVREVLVQLRDYFADSNGKSFKTDDLAKTYTITGQGSEKFAGSLDEIHANWLTGKLKIENDEDARSIAAAIYNNAKKKITPIQATAQLPTTKEKINIGNFTNYMVKDVYGTENNLRNDFGKITDDKKRQQIVMTNAKNFITNFLTNAEKNSNDYDYQNIDKLKELQLAIDENDWDSFKTKSYPFKWEVGDFLIQPDEQKQFEEAAAATEAANKVNLQKNYSTNFKSLGLPEAISNSLAAAGFNKTIKLPLSFNNRNLTEEFNNYLKTKNLYVVTNESGQKAIVGANGIVNSDGSEFKEFNPLRGVAWTHDANNNLSFVQSNAKSEDLGDVGRQLKINIPGYEDWTITGWSRQSLDEPVTTRDYTKYLIFNKGNQKFKIAKDRQNQYKLPDGNIFSYNDINGYTGTLSPINYYETPSEFESIPFSNNYYSSETLAPVISEVTDLLLDQNQEIDAYDKKKITDVIGNLKRISHTTRNQKEKADALKTLTALNTLLNNAQVKLKLGGIIKAQQGTLLDPKLEQFIKSTSQTTQTDPSTVSKKSRDISNTLRGSTGLDKAILATNAGMLAPGWTGVISGLAATGLEAYKGATDADGWSWKDTGQLALNLGLSGAAFIGLGGLKNVVKGAKNAKEIIEITKLGKSTRYANAEIKTSIKELQTFASKEKIPFTLKDIGSIAKKDAAITEHLNKVATFAEEVAKSPKLLSGLTMNGAKTFKLIDNVGKTAAITNAAVNIGGAVDAVKKVASGNISDLSLDEINALTSVAFGAKVGTNMTQIKLGKKYGITPTTKTESKLTTTVNGEEYSLTDPNLIKEFKNYKILPKAKAEKTKKLNDAFLKEINKDVTDPTKAVKAEQLGEIKFTKGSEGEFKIKSQDEYDTKKNLWLQEKGIKWAKKHNLAPAEVTTKPKTEKVIPKTENVQTIEKEIKKVTRTFNQENFKRLQMYKRAVKADAKKLKADINPKLKPRTIKAKIKKIDQQTEEKIKLLKDNIKINKLGGILKLQTGTGSGGLDIQTKPGFLKEAKSWMKNNFDSTSFANSLMYINALNANKKIEPLGNRAIADGLYQLTTLPQINLRTSATNTLQAAESAAQTKSLGKHMASSTSDINRGFAVRLAADKQAQELLSKGQVLDLERNDKIKDAQLKLNEGRLQNNLQISNQNKALTAEAFKNISLNRINNILINSTANTNAITTAENNKGQLRYKKEMEKFWQMSNDPKIKVASEMYTQEAGEEGKNKALAIFNQEREKYKGTDKENITFEESDAYKKWTERKNNLEKSLSLILEPIKLQQNWIQFHKPLMFKSGGRHLSKEEKIEIENAKAENASRLKRMELNYKAILHNNEMLQKSLIKIFK